MAGGMFDFAEIFTAAGLVVLGQVILIDLTMAGDNVVIIGTLTSGLPARERRRVIMLGVAIALVFLIAFALVATQLAEVHRVCSSPADCCCCGLRSTCTASCGRRGRSPPTIRTRPAWKVPRQRKTFLQAAVQITIADLSMSLDNVLAVAAAARDHPSVLVRRPGPLGHADGRRGNLCRAAGPALPAGSLGLGLPDDPLRRAEDDLGRVARRGARLRIGLLLMNVRDTISALSSGRPPAAISVIRVSGPRAHEAAERIAGPLPEARMAAVRQLRHQRSGELLDEGLVLRFDSPASSTGEDSVEFQCHGGRAVVDSMLTALSEFPRLRQAEPGEFTRRAFENGRIDLTEAEGLADLIEAETESQRKAALALAEGSPRKQITSWLEQLLGLSARAERAIDYDEEDEAPDPASLRECSVLAAESSHGWAVRGRSD